VLKRLLQEVRLVPSADGLVAEVRVPGKRLVALTGRTSPQNSSGSGGVLGSRLRCNRPPPPWLIHVRTASKRRK